MDLNVLTIIILLIAIAIAITSLIFGIKFLIKYKTTRKFWYLVLGIILTFILPALLFLVALRYVGTNVMIDYGPGPGMVYGPAPI